MSSEENESIGLVIEDDDEEYVSEEDNSNNDNDSKNTKKINKDEDQEVQLNNEDNKRDSVGLVIVNSEDEENEEEEYEDDDSVVDFEDVKPELYKSVQFSLDTSPTKSPMKLLMKSPDSPQKSLNKSPTKIHKSPIREIIRNESVDKRELHPPMSFTGKKKKDNTISIEKMRDFQPPRPKVRARSPGIYKNNINIYF